MDRKVENMDYFASKQETLQKSIDWWNPGKTKQWQVDGVDVVIGKREGYYFYDVDGKKLMNAHLNGGTYNLGHRNPEVIAALIEGTNYFDIGNHHFPSTARAQLAEALAQCTPDGLKYTIFSSGGSEAIDAKIEMRTLCDKA